MKFIPVLALASTFLLAITAPAQQASQPQLAISPTNRTLTVTASDSITVDPDLAILHIGYDTQLEDAKQAYADGAQTSNTIIGAIKQAGIAETAIHSESQYLDRDATKPHKFRLSQHWTVKVPPERAAEILDIAVTAGATSSGEIEWTVKDEHALEQQALDHAAARTRENAEVLAKGMGVHLGTLIYVSNQLTSPIMPRPMMARAMVAGLDKNAQPPLAIEPQKVSRDATVYAVFAIE
ncbi:MAG TPA: SIMPL domain-containing protein [Terracidiphilus sp.]|jgi:uncharacterized protein YggE|nr:SIMPL domain-containing protein [Terracidiphilus sp.]